MASDLRRTATTVYPCYVPILGDSTGAGRVGLAVANIGIIRILARKMKQFHVKKVTFNEFYFF